jgi:hypothetical protein
MAIQLSGIHPSPQKIVTPAVSRTSNQPVSFSGAPVNAAKGINYGKIWQQFRSHVNWKNISAIFQRTQAKIARFIEKITPGLQKADSTVRKQAGNLWQRIKPVTNAAVK